MTSTPKKSGKWLVFALGNPGGEFENTYHNAGTMALPVFIKTLAGVESETLGWKAHKKLLEYAEPHLTPPCPPKADPPRAEKGEGVQTLVFAWSLMFMNESGRAVAEAVKKFGVSPDHLVILQDDSDITLGEFKLSFDRSSGGHKGAQSVIDHLKTQVFWRVRFGVRPVRETKRKRAGDFVLSTLTPTARKKLEIVFEKAAEELVKEVSA